VDERRLELERLERRIFPVGRTLVHQESASSLQAQSAADDSTANITFLEEAFQKLKAATGTQFISQHGPVFWLGTVISYFE
jgi:hypothetical protein